MPSDLSYWLISAPLKDGDPNVMLNEVRQSLGNEAVLGAFEIPELKVSSLLSHIHSPVMTMPIRCLGIVVHALSHTCPPWSSRLFLPGRSHLEPNAAYAAN